MDCFTMHDEHGRDFRVHLENAKAGVRYGIRFSDDGPLAAVAEKDGDTWTVEYAPAADPRMLTRVEQETVGVARAALRRISGG